MGTLSHFEPQQQQFFMNSMNSKRNDSDGEARRIIEAAAKLIKSDIKDLGTRKDVYPSKEEI